MCDHIEPISSRVSSNKLHSAHALRFPAPPLPSLPLFGGDTATGTCAGARIAIQATWCALHVLDGSQREIETKDDRAAVFDTTALWSILDSEYRFRTGSWQKPKWSPSSPFPLSLFPLHMDRNYVFLRQSRSSKREFMITCAPQHHHPYMHDTPDLGPRPRGKRETSRRSDIVQINRLNGSC